jgi:hypothetical protein
VGSEAGTAGYHNHNDIWVGRGDRFEDLSCHARCAVTDVE